MPESVVMDGGAEFGSADVETFCASNYVEPVRRPGKPRFGAAVERIFGTSDTMLIHSMAGNTKGTKLVRQLSRNMDPKKFAVWTLPLLAALLGLFFHEIYDERPHPALDGASPRDAYNRLTALTGTRPHRLLVLDKRFEIESMPSVRNGTANVKAGDGVSIHGRYYWCNAFDLDGVPGTNVPVRVDPTDVRHAWALVKSVWVEVFCLPLQNLPPMTPEELEIATAEIERLPAAVRRAQAGYDGEVLGALVSSGRATEKLLRQRAVDRANAGADAVASGSSADYRQFLATVTPAWLPDEEGNWKAAPIRIPAADPTSEASPVAPDVSSEEVAPGLVSVPLAVTDQPATTLTLVRPADRHVPQVRARDLVDDTRIPVPLPAMALDRNLLLPALDVADDEDF